MKEFSSNNLELAQSMTAYYDEKVHNKQLKDKFKKKYIEKYLMILNHFDDDNLCLYYPLGICSL